jgi:AcrR family transcriptional regulator
VGTEIETKQKPRKKRQRLSAEKRREQIIAAAQKAFVRLGMNGTRTRDLAEAAGVNEATLFLYFKNKQEIFDASIVEPLSALVKLQLEKGEAFAIADDSNIKDSIGIEAHQQIQEAMSELYPLLVTALFSDEKTGRKIYKRDIYPVITQMSKAAKLSFGLEDDKMAEFVVVAALGLNFVNLMHHRFLGIKPDPDRIAAQISSLMLHGLE